ncbi:MAG: chemotaxis-specific protein-glutamate methyltransferase CheB [Actinomycetota bacterium]
MDKKRIKILIVEDSPVATLILKRIFASCPEIEVVGTAANGKEALSLIPRVQPDVICTDLHMAGMNGLEFTREVMANYPRPILAISASVQQEDTENVFKLLEAGAVDVFPKPTSGLASDYERISRELIGKIKILSGVKVFTQHRRKNEETDVGKKTRGTEMNPTVIPSERAIHNGHLSVPFTPYLETPKLKTIQILAIGASTGGPQALHTILTQLPAHFPVPVVCVQHISEGFLQGLVDWLGSESKLPVKIASMGELPKAGTVYFPPERRHLELDSRGRFIASDAPPVGGHRPSVTVTLKSIASFYGANSVAVLLTGMGRDGAEGMQAIARAGGLTIAQDEASCVVFGMPKEAIALGAVQHILPVSAIAPLLLTKMHLRRS